MINWIIFYERIRVTEEVQITSTGLDILNRPVLRVAWVASEPNLRRSVTVPKQLPRWEARDRIGLVCHAIQLTGRLTDVVTDDVVSHSGLPVGVKVELVAVTSKMSCRHCRNGPS